MPDITPNLGLKKPLGNETVSRASYNENLDIIDQNAVKKGEGIAELTGGTLAQRPAPGIIGRYYFAQDKGAIYLDIGTDWILAAASQVDLSNLQTTVSTHFLLNAIDAHTVIPMCKISYNVSQMFTSGTLTRVLFNEVIFDTDAMKMVDNTGITINTSGKYLLMAKVWFHSNTTGNRKIFLKRNEEFIAEDFRNPVSAEVTTSFVATICNLNKNDIVTVHVIQNSGVTLESAHVGERTPFLTAVKVG